MGSLMSAIGISSASHLFGVDNYFGNISDHAGLKHILPAFQEHEAWSVEPQESEQMLASWPDY